MKKIVVKKIYYKCSVCGTNYGSKTNAKKCENKPIEKKYFKVGDIVQVGIVCVCQCPNGLRIDDYDDYVNRFKPKGKVTKIQGPLPPDEEYEYKWLSRIPGRSPNSQHVYWYEVKFACPECKDKRGIMAYAPELKKITGV